jgi:hypothetical protein
MTTYTTHRQNNNALSGLSVEDAAREILWADGQDFEIRREEDCWRLWQRKECANVKWHAVSSIWSFEEAEDAAEADIFQQVVNRCLKGRWDRYTDIMTDEAYDAMLAQLAADRSEDTA